MTFQRYLRKLRLRPGDIILLRRTNYMLSEMNTLQKVGQAAGIKFNVPIISVNDKNDIRRMSFEELERIYLEARAAYDNLEARGKAALDAAIFLASRGGE